MRFSQAFPCRKLCSFVEKKLGIFVNHVDQNPPDQNLDQNHSSLNQNPLHQNPLDRNLDQKYSSLNQNPLDQNLLLRFVFQMVCYFEMPLFPLVPEFPFQVPCLIHQFCFDRKVRELLL